MRWVLWNQDSSHSCLHANVQAPSRRVISRLGAIAEIQNFDVELARLSEKFHDERPAIVTNIEYRVHTTRNTTT
jgi:hypothetical protein